MKQCQHLSVDYRSLFLDSSKFKMPANGDKKGKASSSKAKDVFHFDADYSASKAEVLITIPGKL